MKDNEFYKYGYKVGEENGSIKMLDRLLDDKHYLAKFYLADNAAQVMDEIAKRLLINQVEIPHHWLESDFDDNITKEDIDMFISGYNDGKQAK